MAKILSTQTESKLTVLSIEDVSQSYWVSLQGRYQRSIWRKCSISQRKAFGENYLISGK
jgi:hypothetical protein